MSNTSLTVNIPEKEPVPLDTTPHANYLSPSAYLTNDASTPTPTPPPSGGVAEVPTATGVAPSSREEQIAGIQAQALSIQDILNQRSLLESVEYDEGEEYNPFDEEAAKKEARRNQLKLHQAEIDATNQVYDQLLSEARLEGEGRLGSQRAMAARGGILGSDFAGAQKGKVQGYNTDIQRGIQAERTAAIGVIMGDVRTRVQEEVTAKREAKEAGAAEYSDYLAGKSQRQNEYKQQLAQTMLLQGMDINDYSEEELNEMLKGSGLKAVDVMNEYAIQKAGGGDEKKYTLKEGETLVNSAGETVASIPGEPVVYKEGDLIVNADGTTTKVSKTTAPKSTGPGGTIYGEKDIPGDVRNDLIDDISAGQTEQQLIALYPDVNLETIQSFAGQFAPVEESGNFWDFIPGVGE